jgi:hypothetical protein
VGGNFVLLNSFPTSSEHALVSRILLYIGYKIWTTRQVLIKGPLISTATAAYQCFGSPSAWAKTGTIPKLYSLRQPNTMVFLRDYQPCTWHLV